MVLPLIMRTTEEALMSVPDSFREGSFGLGAGRLRTVFKIIVPSAMPGILSGVILAIGRIVGETAALMYTAGTATSVCASPMGTRNECCLCNGSCIAGDGYLNQPVVQCDCKETDQEIREVEKKLWKINLQSKT